MQNLLGDTRREKQTRKRGDRQHRDEKSLRVRVGTKEFLCSVRRSRRCCCFRFLFLLLLSLPVIVVVVLDGAAMALGSSGGALVALVAFVVTVVRRERASGVTGLPLEATATS